MIHQAVDERINAFVKGIKRENPNFQLYQEITAKYFTSKYMNRGDMLLLYWDMGSGKTIGSLLCAVRALEETKGTYDRIVVLSPKSVHSVFVANLKKLFRLMYRSPIEAFKKFYEYKDKLILIAYNAWNAYKQFVALGNLEHTIFIIDEAHLFIKSVLKVNVEQSDMKRVDKKGIGNAKRIYDKIRALHTKKILCLTGTPLAKFSFELVPLFNLSYRDQDLFTENFKDFQSTYYDEVKQQIRPEKKDALMKKLDGRVSFVPATDSGVKVSKLKDVLVEMSAGQFRQYVYDYCLELEENGFSNSVNVFGVPFGSISSYHTKTFQDCLYWNDELKIKDYKEVVLRSYNNMKGGGQESDSDESTSSESEEEDGYDEIFEELSKLMENEEATLESLGASKDSDIGTSLELVESTTPTTKQSAKQSAMDVIDLDSDDEEPPQTMSNEEPPQLMSNEESSQPVSDEEPAGMHTSMKDYFTQDFSKFAGGAVSTDNDPRHKIKKWHIDMNHCPKLIKMYEDSQKHKGIKCFYFRLTNVYGCDTMEKVLQKYGYSLASTDALNTVGKRYVLFTGNVSDVMREEYMKMINAKKNMLGEYIEYIIISPSGQVGISLHNVRFLGIGTTEFAYSTIRQIQTRCVRFRSHDDLPPSERTLEQRIYFASPNKKYLREHYTELSKILSRTDPLITNEKHPSIERIIYYNSIRDDIPMQAFRKLLYKASITEKLVHS